MSLELPQYEGFPENGFWRLDWFGGLTRNFEAREPLLNLLFTDLGENAIHSKGAHQELFSVGVGSLPSFLLGSVWTDGICLGLYSDNNISTVTFKDIDVFPSTMQFEKAGHSDSGKYLIPPYIHKITSMGMGTYCLALHKDGNDLALLIPVIELIRFYYARTTNLALALLHSGIGDKGEKLFNPKGSDLKSKPPVFQLRKEMENESVTTLGRLALNKHAMAGAKKILYSMQKKPGAQMLHPQTFPPFVGRTTIEADGLWLNQEKTSFLVLRMLTCTHPFPFKGLDWRRDTDENVDNKTAELPSQTKRIPRQVVPRKKENWRKVTSRANPSRFLKSFKFVSTTNNFPDLKKKRIRRVDKDKLKEKDTKYEFTSGHPPEGLSTGVDTYSDTGRAKANVVKSDDAPEKEKKPAIPVRILTLKKALDELAKEKDVSVNFIQIGIDDDDDIEDWVSLIPETWNNQSLSFARLKEGSRRRCIVAEVVYEAKHFYVLEIERDPLRIWQKLSTLILYTDGFEMIGAAKFFQMIATVAEKGSWSHLKCDGVDSAIRTMKMNHSTHKAKEIAEKTLGKIKSKVVIAN